MISNIVILSTILIFAARVCDVSMATFRMLLIVKGKRLQAAIVGFFEIMIYLFSLTYVLKAGGLDNVANIIAYAGGFATGNFMGSFIEEKIMNGHVLVEVILSDVEKGMELVEELRDQGFGTTVLRGEGKGGMRLVLKVVCDRKSYRHVLDLAHDYEGFAFLVDLKSVFGGTFLRKGR